MAGWDDLSAAQREAVHHHDGPCAVYAGPGSGKTRVVTLRAVRLAQQGHRTLVTTFTADATSEMSSRIRSMLTPDAMTRLRVTTLHSYCLALLKQHQDKFTLLTDEFQRKSLAESAQAATLEGGVSAFLSRMTFEKNSGHTAATYTHDGSSDDMDFARAWRSFEKEKKKRGMLDFDDLLLEASALLNRDEAVRSAAASQFSHIIVDECQDMNSPQYQVVFSLGRDHQNLMLVGDPDQSLYGFRGADTHTFKRFAAQPKVKVFELQENYRCTNEILKFADCLIRQDADRRPIAFRATRLEGDAVTWARYADPDIEALGVGDAVLRLHKTGLRWRDMAVLYRTNVQAEAIERNFAALEIPYTIRDDGDFYSRREVQGILAYLSFFSGPPPSALKQKRHGANAESREIAESAYPDEWLLALMNVPDRKIGRTVGSQLKDTAEIRGKRIWDVLPEFHADDLRTHRSLRELMQDLAGIESKLPGAVHAGDAIHIIRNIAGIDTWLRRDAGDDSNNDRLQNVQRMQSAAAHYKTIAEYLEAVKRVRDEAARRKAERQKKRREQDEVCLSTGHSAKGLEWRCVFAIGWSEVILPHYKAEDINEERRIAYVIATRARDLLRVSSIDSWNDAVTTPSRFLTGLNLAIAQPASNTDDCDEDDYTASLAEDGTIHEPELGGLFVP